MNLIAIIAVVFVRVHTSNLPAAVVDFGGIVGHSTTPIPANHAVLGDYRPGRNKHGQVVIHFETTFDNKEAVIDAATSLGFLAEPVAVVSQGNIMPIVHI